MCLDSPHINGLFALIVLVGICSAFTGLNDSLFNSVNRIGQRQPTSLTGYKYLYGHDNFVEQDNDRAAESLIRRRAILAAVPTALTTTSWMNYAHAASLSDSNTKSSTKDNYNTEIEFPPKLSSVEDCLIELLPIRNKVFEQLIDLIDGIIPSSTDGKNLYKVVAGNSRLALEYLDNYRIKLEPAFNLNDEDTMLQILRNERFEQLLEALRRNLETITQYANVQLLAELFPLLKTSKILLAEIGGLLVEKFPYDVPTEDGFSTLPRLQGRTRVTFSLAQKSSKLPLGNVTIIADGYAAPLTAGHFVDLAMRNFYTGLPAKVIKKNWSIKPFDDANIATTIVGRLGSAVDTLENAAKEIDGIVEKGILKKDIGEDRTTSSITILGSFQNGFIDPLTAKPRNIPFECVKIDKTSRIAKSLPIIYSVSGQTLSREDDARQRYATPLLTFDIPGLVAMNHPDRNLNGGNSEFFSLPLKDISKERVDEMNGRYAPFGYIVEGLSLMQSLDSDIEISSTYVDTWGRQRLVKVRDISFANVMQ